MRTGAICRFAFSITVFLILLIFARRHGASPVEMASKIWRVVAEILNRGRKPTMGGPLVWDFEEV
jgi:hypothetical protein